MSTVFRPRSKRAVRGPLLRSRPPMGTASQLVLGAGRSRVYVGESSFLVPYEADKIAAVMAQNDPASVIGLPTTGGRTEFVRVGHVSRVAPA